MSVGLSCGHLERGVCFACTQQAEIALLRARVKAVEAECERQRLAADSTFRSRRAALTILRAMNEAKP